MQYFLLYQKQNGRPTSLDEVLADALVVSALSGEVYLAVEYASDLDQHLNGRDYYFFTILLCLLINHSLILCSRSSL